MDAIKALSSLQFEVKIMNAKNIQFTNSKGYLFVRCYLSAGNNKRVRLESQDVSPNGEVYWNESFSLDCLGTKQSMDMIIQGTVVFELRWRRSTVPLFKKIIGGDGNDGGSQLLGRAEVPWRGIFESQNMESERWIVMRSKKSVAKAPLICVNMKVQVPPVVLVKERKTRKDVGRLKNIRDESCGCSHGHCCQNLCADSEIVAIGLALDAF